MTASAPLVEFLTARLDEDEAVARAATPGPWQWDDRGDDDPVLETVARGKRYSDGSEGAAATIINAWGHDEWGVVVEDADAAHIARHDPTRVLAQVAASRTILEAHGPLVIGSQSYCSSCGDVPVEDFPCETVRALTAPYAGHPDYDAKWAL